MRGQGGFNRIRGQGGNHHHAEEGHALGLPSPLYSATSQVPLYRLVREWADMMDVEERDRDLRHAKIVAVFNFQESNHRLNKMIAVIDNPKTLRH